ncbi:unnamed protein product [Diabrotica balteata]|uniref:Ig-like domain-containing protein n=1 Tax=Diabrotica balteata TaxID=107213 RepID=A0A9N9TA65_DIABA|nr:unnamed protein product [Diabrotica balteata]
MSLSVATPLPSLSWFRDDQPVTNEPEKYIVFRENLGVCHLDIQPVELNDQAEWKCVATNDFGHSVTSCFLKLSIPKHFRKPKFLECLRAVLTEEGAVNLECKVIGVPQPVLKWYKDGIELKPGDIHRITSGQRYLKLCLEKLSPEDVDNNIFSGCLANSIMRTYETLYSTDPFSQETVDCGAVLFQQLKSQA